MAELREVQRPAPPFIYIQHDAARPFYCLRDQTVKDRVAVVEDGDAAVGQAASVVLEAKSAARTHLEVALLASKAPDDLTTFSVYLVDGEGLAGRDEQVVVVIYFYGVDVEVVEPPAAILRHRGIALLETHMI